MDRNKEIYKKIASDQGMFAKQVEKIVQSQFKFVLSSMASKKASDIRLPYIGRIRVAGKRLQLYRERVEKFTENLLTDAITVLWWR